MTLCGGALITIYADMGNNSQTVTRRSCKRSTPLTAMYRASYRKLYDHGDMWSHCFPEGIVNAAYPNHLWFQCLGHDADLQINSNGSKLIQNWNCPIIFKVMFFYIHYQIENMNRKGIMWVKASEGTAVPCGFTRHPQHGMGKITIKVL